MHCSSVLNHRLIDGHLGRQPPAWVDPGAGQRSRLLPGIIRPAIRSRHTLSKYFEPRPMGWSGHRAGAPADGTLNTVERWATSRRSNTCIPAIPAPQIPVHHLRLGYGLESPLAAVGLGPCRSPRASASPYAAWRARRSRHRDEPAVVAAIAQAAKCVFPEVRRAWLLHHHPLVRVRAGRGMRCNGAAKVLRLQR